MEINQFKIKFKDEAASLFTSLDNTLIELEKNPGDIYYLNEAFRFMHTIKGTSSMFGFNYISELTHELESLFDIIRNSKQVMPQQLLEVTFTASDHLRALLSDEELSDPGNRERQEIIKKNIEKIKINLELTNQPVASEDKLQVQNTEKVHKSSWNILFYPSDHIIDRAINLVYTFQDLFMLGEYKINNSPLEIDDTQIWSIFLVTDKSYNEIEDALMFIMDYCKINKLADFDIFEPFALEPVKKPPEISISKIDVKSIPPENETITNQPEIGTPSATSVIQKYKTSRINVDSSKLDQLMYLVSELVTSKSELLLALQVKNEEKAMDIAFKIEKLSKLFSENALSIRLVSLSEMLTKFKRLIRDLSKQLGKEIIFDISGEETELDKNIIDNIGEPIMHLIRNCIDHGIEIPSSRLEKGKQEKGTIKFEAQKTGNFVYISVSDDGNGIDTDYIYKKGVEKGFVAPGTELSHKEILDIIFLPGFSTAQSLTNVSGRGVGMDIVLKKIQEIRGEISVSSKIGEGTTFTIKLQQTISIIETLLIKAGGFTYAIPVEDIDSCILEVGDNILDTQNHLIGYNNHLIPYINLRTKFSLNVTDNKAELEKLIIINRVDKTYAIVADKIIGEFQAVVKPLGNAFKSLKFLSGASLLGDGSIALLLDTDKLWYEMN